MSADYAYAAAPAGNVVPIKRAEDTWDPAEPNADTIAQRWDPESQFIGALMWLTADRARPILELVRDRDIERPLNRWAFELIRLLVDAGENPNPVLVVRAAMKQAPADYAASYQTREWSPGGQGGRYHQLTLHLAAAYDYVVGYDAGILSYAREVLDDSYRRAIRFHGTKCSRWPRRWPTAKTSPTTSPSSCAATCATSGCAPTSSANSPARDDRNRTAMYKLTIDYASTGTAVTSHTDRPAAWNALQRYAVGADVYLHTIQATEPHSSYDLVKLTDRPRAAGCAVIEQMPAAAEALYYRATEARRWIDQHRSEPTGYPARVLARAPGRRSRPRSRANPPAVSGIAGRRSASPQCRSGHPQRLGAPSQHRCPTAERCPSGRHRRRRRDVPASHRHPHLVAGTAHLDGTALMTAARALALRYEDSVRCRAWVEQQPDSHWWASSHRASSPS